MTLKKELTSIEKDLFLDYLSDYIEGYPSKFLNQIDVKIMSKKQINTTVNKFREIANGFLRGTFDPKDQFLVNFIAKFSDPKVLKLENMSRESVYKIIEMTTDVLSKINNDYIGVGAGLLAFQPDFQEQILNFQINLLRNISPDIFFLMKSGQKSKVFDALTTLFVTISNRGVEVSKGLEMSEGVKLLNELFDKKVFQKSRDFNEFFEMLPKKLQEKALALKINF